MTKKSSKSRLKVAKMLAISAFLCSSPLGATADSAMSCSKASNSNLKELRLRLGGDLGEKAAFSLGGDLCRKSVRTSACVGYEVTDLDAVKVSAEYLNQKLDYNFARTSTEAHKRHQVALGAGYQRKVDLGWISNIDVGAGYSYAPSKTLSAQTDDYFSDHRHLAGTRFYSASVGATTAAWENASIRVSACWDHFEINRSFHNSRRVTGVGAGLNLKQGVTECLTAEAKAEYHRAYNVYGAALNCHGLKKGLVVGAFIERTHARYNLPNTTTVGLQLSYRLGSDDPATTPNTVSEWVNIPAFSQPEVLVATDELQVHAPG